MLAVIYFCTSAPPSVGNFTKAPDSYTLLLTANVRAIFGESLSHIDTDPILVGTDLGVLEKLHLAFIQIYLY
jgi:hypothetical protein